ncbi:helix-turn-helix domain-containing protein [Streptomyces sp. N2-109]|uniref:Helix-turn-helix domain-containing protein n=1 Tax=Streptomyces gossypii TaxID=2883101 RepID=A0ABT2JTZ9_9ACTN|nr:helix-turn-helix domain-containing protein [Streptomyces gossypii]MCT2590959.1 helix-turn-helix domain-containing protein [Streptomyces gossypii]
MRSLTQPDATDLDLVAVLHALSDPVRLELVRLMASGGEVSCSPEHLDIPRSTLSSHWRILREAGLTWTRPEGKARYMTLRRDDLEARFPGVLTAILACAAVPSDSASDPARTLRG